MRQRMIGWLGWAGYSVALLLLGMLAMCPPAQANNHTTSITFWGAPTVGTVYVQSSLDNSSWNSRLVSATKYLDGYTSSTIRNKKCHSDLRCITVKFGTAPGTALGRTVCHAGNCVITVEKGAVPSLRTDLLIHELGHAFALSHNARCVSIMYPYRTCWTHLTGQPFTASERAILRKH